MYNGRLEGFKKSFFVDGKPYWVERGQTIPQNAVPRLGMPVETLKQYDPGMDGGPTNPDSGFVLLVDLERLVGEDIIAEGLIRTVGTTSSKSEDVYRKMRQPVVQLAPEKLSAFDSIWKKQVFGLGKLPQVSP